MLPKRSTQSSAPELYHFHAGFLLSLFQRLEKRLQRSLLVFTTASRAWLIHNCSATFWITTKSANTNPAAAGRKKSRIDSLKPVSRSDRKAKTRMESSPKWGRQSRKAFSIFSHPRPAGKFCDG